MIKGMTGFGSEQFSVNGVKALLELKSVNHRYLDVSYYLPIGFSSVENKVKALLDAEMARGRVTVTMKFLEKPAQSIAMNTQAVQDYLTFGKKIKKQFNLQGDLTVSDLLTLPGIFEIKENFLSAADVWPQMEKALNKALKQLISMRRAEGRSLTADLNDKARRMTRQLAIIEKRKKTLLAERRKTGTPEEFSSFQKSSDINEELTRMKHYLEEIRTILRSSESIGKKIDFIAQEMQRETNTIGSKVQDRTVSNAVIAMKSKIEKIREQAQNIE